MKGLEKLFPEFRKKVKWWRFAGILILRRFMRWIWEKILPFETRIKGLFLAGMFSYSNYPERA